MSTHSELHLGAVSTISSSVFLCCDHLLCDNEKGPLPDLRVSREVINATEPLCYRHHWDAMAKWTAAASLGVLRKCQVIVSHFSVFAKNFSQNNVWCAALSQVNQSKCH